MNKREAKKEAIDYVIGCVAEHQAGEETVFWYREDLSEKDQDKILREVREICWSLGDRRRRLENAAHQRNP